MLTYILCYLLLLQPNRISVQAIGWKGDMSQPQQCTVLVGASK